MAITLRTVLTSPAAAAVASVSLFGMAVLTTQLGGVDFPDAHQAAVAAPCAHLGQQLGPDARQWSERSWAIYASCFEKRGDSRAVVEIAEDGLRHFPRSEVLYSIKGIHEIVLNEHHAAVRTLSRGLAAIGASQTGTMENNLAWAALWTGDLIPARGRQLYEAALAKSPQSCEILHTGLMVEYQAAKTGGVLDRAEALKNFESLRVRYERCEGRVTAGEWKTLGEVVGASVVYDEVDRMMGIERSADQPNPTMIASARVLRERSLGGIASLCREAMPMVELRGRCVESVYSAMKQARAEEQGRLERRDLVIDEVMNSEVERPRR